MEFMAYAFVATFAALGFICFLQIIQGFLLSDKRIGVSIFVDEISMTEKLDLLIKEAGSLLWCGRRVKITVVISNDVFEKLKSSGELDRMVSQVIGLGSDILVAIPK